jgi:hypothetical protein
VKCKICVLVSFLAIDLRLLEANVKVEEVCRAKVADLEKFMYHISLRHIFPLNKFYSLLPLSRRNHAKTHINIRLHYLRLGVF